MSLCRLMILLQVHLCRPRILAPLPWSSPPSCLPLLMLRPLRCLLIPCLHEPKLVFSKLATRRILLSWDPLVFSLLYLCPLSPKDSNLLLRILLGSPLWMKKFKPCKLIIPGFWFLDLPTPILWVQMGVSNKILA
jgi:hypothetical protein